MEPEADAAQRGGDAQGALELSQGQGTELTEQEIAQQRALFQDLLRDEPALKEGDTWYLIAARWYQQWEAFVQIDGDRGRPGIFPGPINNIPLLDPQTPGSLLTYMRENQDYVIKHPDVWTKLLEIYGGGPAIPRKVVASLWNAKSVEVFPLRLQFFKSSDMNAGTWALFSKSAKIKEVRAEMCTRLGVKPNDIRIWDYHNDTKLKILEEPLNSLAEERILDGQKMLFEERLPSGQFAKLATARDREYDNRYNHPSAPGLCGLSNLGNTCFMNSGLQCLSNTVPLAHFMVTGKYEEEMNRDNPLGTGGELVAEFADLLQDMWSGRLSTVAPRDFKWKLERFAPQFSGWQQHDSQELLAFLLDGMHEDMNRVKKKPYFETNEFEHLPEREAADKSWAQHIARNNSFVTDWCHGLLRSEVKCNVCPRVSKVFDPFMYMTVPLPEAKTRFLEVLYWSQDFSKPPTRYGIMAPKYGTIEDFMKAVSTKTGYSAEMLQLCDVYSQRFFKLFKGDDKMTQVTERDILYVFECVNVDDDVVVADEGAPEPMQQDGQGVAPMQEVKAAGPESLVNVVVQFKEERTYQSLYYTNATPTLQGLDPPLIVAVPRAVTYKRLYEYLSHKLARFFVRPAAPDALAEGGASTHDAPPASELPLFQIYRGGRSGQFKVEDIPDDEVMLLSDADNICLALDTPKCQRRVFASDEARACVVDESAKQEASGEGRLNLEQCIALYGEEEQLSEDDPWYCSQCKEHRRAFKKFAFWKLPKILIIHLKRFSYRNKHWREKIESVINFPLEGLDMGSFVQGPTEGIAQLYDLYAISNHYGGMGGGHYTAFALNCNDKKWYKFDDTSVSVVHDPQQVITSAAYVLFYQRRDTKPAPGFTMPLPARAQPAPVAATPPAADAADGFVRVTQLGNSTASTEEGLSDSDGDDDGENSNRRMNESE